MFKANDNNRKTENKERIYRSRPSKPSQIRFCDLAEFSDWIDSQLDELEQRYREFETVSSLRGHYER